MPRWVEHPLQLDALLVEEGHDAIVQEIGGGKRDLSVVEFGEGSDFRVGVDEGLLIDASHALHVADIEGVLGSAIARMLAVEPAMGFFFGLGFRQGGSRGTPSRMTPSWATLASSAFSRFSSSPDRGAARRSTRRQVKR